MPPTISHDPISATFAKHICYIYNTISAISAIYLTMDDVTHSDMLCEAARRHLFVTDLDGTLLDNEGRVPPMTARVISDLSHMGALITVATARTPATVDRILAHTFTRLPLIVMTGAALWNRPHRCYADPRPIAPDLAGEAYRLCLSAGLSPFVYNLTDDGMLHVHHVGDISPLEQRFIRDRSQLLLKQFHFHSEMAPTSSFDATMLLLAMGPVEDVMKLGETMRLSIGLTVQAYPDNYDPRQGVLEVFAQGVSKAAAVRAMAERTGAEWVTVFGDNLNDLPMMEVADEAVAVANAMPEVIERADTVIGPNSEESVARYILESLGLVDCNDRH